MLQVKLPGIQVLLWGMCLMMALNAYDFTQNKQTLKLYTHTKPTLHTHTHTRSQKPAKPESSGLILVVCDMKTVNARAHTYPMLHKQTTIATCRHRVILANTNLPPVHRRQRLSIGSNPVEYTCRDAQHSNAARQDLRCATHLYTCLAPTTRPRP